MLQHRHALRLDARDFREAECSGGGKPKLTADDNGVDSCRGPARNSSMSGSPGADMRPWRRAPAAPRRNRHRAPARTDCRRRSPCCGSPARQRRAPPVARAARSAWRRDRRHRHRRAESRVRPGNLDAPTAPGSVVRTKVESDDIAFIGGAHDQRAAAEIARSGSGERGTGFADRRKGLKRERHGRPPRRQLWPEKWLFSALKPPWKTFSPMPLANVVGLVGRRVERPPSIRHRCGRRR